MRFGFDVLRRPNPPRLDALRDTISLVEKMSGNGLIHCNTAGRYKSRLASRVGSKSAAAWFVRKPIPLSTLEQPMLAILDTYPCGG